MKRTKKPVIKEEVVSIEITIDEFAEIATRTCAELMIEAPDNGMDIDAALAMSLALALADFSAILMHKLFDDEEETEEEAEG